MTKITISGSSWYRYKAVERQLKGIVVYNRKVHGTVTGRHTFSERGVSAVGNS